MNRSNAGDKNLHRKNAAEWVMWVFWFPATRAARWFAGLNDWRRLGLAAGLGCVIGGILQGSQLGRMFLAVGVLLTWLAVYGSVLDDAQQKKDQQQQSPTAPTSPPSNRGPDGLI